MIYKSEQFQLISPNVIQEAFELPDFLDDVAAKALTAKLLRYHLGFTWNLLTGEKIFPFQEFIINGWFKKDYSLYMAARALGKCIDKDSFILSKQDGFKKIIEVDIGEEIYTKDRFCKVLEKRVNPIEDGLEIITRQKFSVKGKLGHQTLVFDPATIEFDFKNIENIKIGDFIPIKFGMNEFGNFDISKYFPNCKCINLKPFNLTIDEDFYYLLGLIIGDGCTRHSGSGSFSVSSEDNSTILFLSEISKKLFPESSFQLISKDGNKATDCKISNKLFIQFLQNIGFDTNAKAHQKNIPYSILNSRKCLLRAFLQGLFDTDGAVSYDKQEKKKDSSLNISFSSSSKELIESLKRTLLNFGIVSSLRLHRKAGVAVVCGKECNIQNAYELTITSKKFIQTFYNEIGFRLDRKQNVVKEWLLQTRDKDYFSNLIPVGKYLRDKYGNSAFRKKLGLRKIYNTISENRLRDIIDTGLLTPSDVDKCRELLNNWVFLPVKNILLIKTQTVDIQVENDKCYWSEGMIHHNSYLIAIFCLLYAIFNPDCKIVIVSSNFRRSKDIFSKMDKFLNKKKQNLLACNFVLPYSKNNEKYTLKCINGSEINALPLGTGENLRGERANVLIIDEGLLVSQGIQETVLEPFILANLDLSNQIKTEELDTRMIEQGLLKENERTPVSRNKIIICSSAPYSFQFLYEGIFLPHLEKINASVGDKEKPSYFVTRSSFHIGIRHKIIQQNAIDKVGADEPGMENDPIIGREYWANAVSGAGGFFNMRAVRECTVKPGERPCVQLFGNKKQEYILSIDPSFSDSPCSDYFAIETFLLLKEERKICLVNTYARAGGETKDHYEYFTYLLENFNIVYIIVDATGTDALFIKTYNESEIAKAHHIQLDFIDADLDAEGDGYVQELHKAKSQWNIAGRKIVHKHTMNATSNRRTAELLALQINAKKVLFGSPIMQNREMFGVYRKFKTPFQFKDRTGRPYQGETDGGTFEFLTDQDDYIRFVQDQLAMIVMNSTNNGSVSFGMPSRHERRGDDPDRPRKDHFSAMVMAAFAAKVVFDMLDLTQEVIQDSFTPFFL